MNGKLSPRRRKFVHEYVKNGFNGVQAIYAAGYKSGYNSACTEAWRLLRNAEVSKAVEDHIKKSQMSAEDVLNELSEVARAEVDIDASQKMKALELVGKYHKLFTDRVETEDKTRSPAQSLVAMAAEKGVELTEDQAEKIMAASIQRARMKVASPRLSNTL